MERSLKDVDIVRELLSKHVATHLVNCLVLSGYNKLHILAKMEESDFCDIEKTVALCAEEMGEPQKLQCLGEIYAKNPGKFRFWPGEKIGIRCAVAEAQRLVRIGGGAGHSTISNGSVQNNGPQFAPAQPSSSFSLNLNSGQEPDVNQMISTLQALAETLCYPAQNQSPFPIKTETPLTDPEVKNELKNEKQEVNTATPSPTCSNSLENTFPKLPTIDTAGNMANNDFANGAVVTNQRAAYNPTLSGAIEAVAAEFLRSQSIQTPRFLPMKAEPRLDPAYSQQIDAKLATMRNRLISLLKRKVDERKWKNCQVGRDFVIKLKPVFNTMGHHVATEGEFTCFLCHRHGNRLKFSVISNRYPITSNIFKHLETKHFPGPPFRTGGSKNEWFSESPSDYPNNIEGIDQVCTPKVDVAAKIEVVETRRESCPVFPERDSVSEGDNSEEYSRSEVSLDLPRHIPVNTSL